MKTRIWFIIKILIIGTTMVSGQKSSTRYIASSVIPQGNQEVKVFNNLYTQIAGGNRNSFNTVLINYLHGVGPRFNIGFDARVRFVSFGPDEESIFNAFGGSENNRSGLTAFGPKIRWAIHPEWNNFSIQSAFTFSLGQNLKGQNGDLFIDWDGPSWNTQLFNDFTLGDDFSLYAEISFIWEDIGQANKGNVNQKSIPFTAILQYFLNPDWTIYGLGNYAPFIQSDPDHYYQYGIGTKWRFNSNFEMEVLITDFNRKILNDINGEASTYNLGLRYSIR